jgi:hypothetical protein
LRGHGHSVHSAGGWWQGVRGGTERMAQGGAPADAVRHRFSRAIIMAMPSCRTPWYIAVVRRFPRLDGPHTGA